MQHGDGDELEWKTRRSRVDPKLRDLGWKIVPFDPDLDLSACTAHAITEYSTKDVTRLALLRSPLRWFGDSERCALSASARG